MHHFANVGKMVFLFFPHLPTNKEYPTATPPTFLRSSRCPKVFESLTIPLLPDFLRVHRLEPSSVLVERGNTLGGAFIAEFRVVPEYHQIDINSNQSPKIQMENTSSF